VFNQQARHAQLITNALKIVAAFHIFQIELLKTLPELASCMLVNRAPQTANVDMVCVFQVYV